MQTVKQALEKARKLLSDKSAWTKGAAARNAEGQQVLSTSPAATSFCAIGAISRVTRKQTIESPVDALRSALPAGFYAVSDFNDAEYTDHKDILALFDRAIEAQKG